MAPPEREIEASNKIMIGKGNTNVSRRRRGLSQERNQTLGRQSKGNTDRKESHDSAKADEAERERAICAKARRAIVNICAYAQKLGSNPLLSTRRPIATAGATACSPPNPAHSARSCAADHTYDRTVQRRGKWTARRKKMIRSNDARQKGQAQNGKENERRREIG